MKYTLFGFNQEKALEYGLDVRDLLLIDYIWDMCASPTMQHLQEKNIIYVWLMHDRILNDLPILNIGKRSLIECLNKLKSFGLLYCKVVNNDSMRGSKSYYAITEKCELLRYDQVQDFAVNQRPSAENCSSDNISISSNNTNNIQQELFTDTNNTEVINKEDTYKERVQNFVARFNEICVSLPKCVRVTPKRNKAIISLLKKFSDLEITEVFKKLEASDFCSGRSGKWRANIDFILSENNFVKTLEGKYDNQAKRNSFEKISGGKKYAVSAEEKEEMRKAVERGELEVY